MNGRPTSEADAVVIDLSDRLVWRRRIRAGVAVAGWAAAAGGVAGALLLAAPWGGRDWMTLACLGAGVLPVLGFAAGALLCRIDRTALLLEVDGRLQTSDTLASAAEFAASGLDESLRRDTVARAASLVEQAIRFWPRKPGVRLAIGAAMAGGVALGIALGSLPPAPVILPPTLPVVPARTEKTPPMDAPRPNLPPDPVRKTAAEAGRRVAAIAEGIVDDQIRARGLKLAEALAAFAEGRGDAAQVLAASSDFAEAAKQAAGAADTPEAREALAKVAKALEVDPLTEAIGRALAKRDLKAAASMLKDLASRLSPEEVRRLSEKFKGLGGNLGLDLPGMLPGDGKGGAGPGPGEGNPPGAAAGENDAGKEPGPQDGPRPKEEAGADRATAAGSEPERERPELAKDPQATAREPGKSKEGAETTTARSPSRSGTQGLSDALKAMVASATGADAAERIRRTGSDGKTGEGAVTEKPGSQKTAESKPGDNPNSGTGGGPGEQAGTGAGGDPLGKEERIAVTLKDEKAGRASREGVSVQEAVLRGATQGSEAPGFREAVRDYRAITAEDLGRTGLPPAMRAMVEAYFDRLER